MNKVVLRTALVVGILAATVLPAHATATYQGTMTGSFEIVSCATGGPIATSCSNLGVSFTGLIPSSNNQPQSFTFGTGVATATETITTFGPGTFIPHPDIPGGQQGTGLAEGTGYSINMAINGSATDPGAGAGSVVNSSPSFSIFQSFGSLATSVTFRLTFDYQNTVAINDPLTEFAFSFSGVDVDLFDFSVTPAVAQIDVVNSECTNSLPPFLGFDGTPCSSNGLQTFDVTVELGTCLASICQHRADADFNQFGAAQVSVPGPLALALVGLGLAQLGVLAWLRRSRRRDR